MIPWPFSNMDMTFGCLSQSPIFSLLLLFLKVQSTSYFAFTVCNFKRYLISSVLVIISFGFLPWRLRQQGPPKCWHVSTKLHSVTSEKTVIKIFIITARFELWSTRPPVTRSLIMVCRSAARTDHISSSTAKWRYAAFRSVMSET
jgi:hypothetical protein